MCAVQSSELPHAQLCASLRPLHKHGPITMHLHCHSSLSLLSLCAGQVPMRTHCDSTHNSAGLNTVPCC